MFLLADAIAITLQNVTEGLVVFPSKINSNIMAELPFMITENVIMRLVAMGVSRQEYVTPSIIISSLKRGKTVTNTNQGPRANPRPLFRSLPPSPKSRQAQRYGRAYQEHRVLQAYLG